MSIFRRFFYSASKKCWKSVENSTSKFRLWFNVESTSKFQRLSKCARWVKSLYVNSSLHLNFVFLSFEVSQSFWYRVANLLLLSSGCFSALRRVHFSFLWFKYDIWSCFILFLFVCLFVCLVFFCQMSVIFFSLSRKDLCLTSFFPWLVVLMLILLCVLCCGSSFFQLHRSTLYGIMVMVWKNIEKSLGML